MTGTQIPLSIISPMPSMVLADMNTVNSWGSVSDAMKASAHHAIHKRDQSNASIAAASGIPTGTISGLFSCAGKAMRTHETRPELMKAMGCIYLAQWELLDMGYVAVHVKDYQDMTDRLEFLENENAKQKELINKTGLKNSAPLDDENRQASRINYGSFTFGGDA